MKHKIAIIGMGHMGKALMKGLLSSGFDKGQIFTANSSRENRKAVEKSDWIFITVKPLVAKTVIAEIADFVGDKIIISAAAGLPISKIVSLSQNKKQKVICIMPNLPVEYKQGVIGFFASGDVSAAERKEVKSIMLGLGTVILCDNEVDLEAVTVLAGCGPAIVSYFVNVFADSGKSLGLKKHVTEEIVLQTIAGTLMLLQETDQTAKELQKAVSTKEGVTEEIIKSLDEKHIQEQITQSLGKGYDKIKKIKEKL